MQTIRTKFHGPTNTRGSRYSASAPCYPEGRRVYVTADDSVGSNENHANAARKLCESIGWTGEMVGGGGGPDCMVWVFTASQSPRINTEGNQ